MTSHNLSRLHPRSDAAATAEEGPAAGHGLIYDAVSGVRAICSKISAEFKKGWNIKVDLIYRCGIGALPLD